jgi:GAF domain-containing protein
MTDDLRAAAATGVLAGESEYRSLLQSIVDVARAIFAARASSIFLLDVDTVELVFEAVSGEGSAELVGRRMPSSTGIAGWVLVTRQPLILDDVQQDPRHATTVAQRTGYVPKRLMSVPLLHDERALGVLQVLDRDEEVAFSLQEMELLGLFANQAAIALDLLQRARKARAVLEADSADVAIVAQLAETVDALDDERRETGVSLLRTLDRLLRPRAPLT